MAWTDFYIQTTGSNLNAGSTTDDAAVYTSPANGAWNKDSGTNEGTFTPVSGDPSATVSAGMWGSLYLDAATTTLCVMKVKSVTSTTIVFDQLFFIGAIPADAANGYTVKVGGAWAGAPAINSLFVSQTIAQATRINWKAGTYTLAADLTFAAAGTTTVPIWWRGYKTTAGDKDARGGTRVVATDLPLIDADTTTDQIIVSGAHQIFSNIAVTSICTDAGGAVSLTGGNIKLVRCNIENTQANAASRALSTSTAGSVVVVGCRIKATTTATHAVNVSVTTLFSGCHFIGGTNTLYRPTYVTNSVISGFGTSGILIDANSIVSYFVNCTVYAAATNCFSITTAPTTAGIFIINCILGGCTNGINNSSAGFTNGVTSVNNHFYSCTNNFVGITDPEDAGNNMVIGSDLSDALLNVDDDTDPFVNKASSDFSLATGNTVDKSTSSSDKTYPAVFEGQTSMTSYGDIGGVQSAPSAAAAGGSYVFIG